MRKVTTIVTLASLFLLMLCGWLPASSEIPKRILLVVMDGARYDYCTPENMPNLFAFMKGGLIFDNAYAPSAWTLPSHASLFTGLYPQQHGAFRLPSRTTPGSINPFSAEINRDDISIPPGATTVADILHRGGYQTIGVFGNPCYGYPIFNLNKGFDTWVNVVENKLKEIGKTKRGFFSFDYQYRGKFFTVIPNASEVAAEVSRVLEETEKERPLFLFINFEDPIATPLYYPPEQRDEIKKTYKKQLAKSMARIDVVLPPLLSFFQTGLIIITADHGQGDGGRFKPTEHYTSLHDYQTRIPLLVHGLEPDKIDVHRPIDLTRIMGIVLGYAGIGCPGKGLFFHPDSPYAFSHLDPNPERPIGEQAHYSIHSNRGTLIVRQLPGLLVNMFYPHQTAGEDIAELLPVENLLAESIAPFIGLRRVFPKTNRRQKLNEDNIEMLKSLGYIQ